MFGLEICHLLERFCSIVVFVLLYTFVLLFALFTPGEPRGPGGEIFYPRIPGDKIYERGWLPYP